MFANRLSLGENFDQLFRQFSLQLSENEMLTFTHMIAHAKISGGVLVQLFKQQSWQLQENQMALEESMTLISGKKYEYQIMVLMPIAIILYLSYKALGYHRCKSGIISSTFVFTKGIFITFTCRNFIKFQYPDYWCCNFAWY